VAVGGLLLLGREPTHAGPIEVHKGTFEFSVYTRPDTRHTSPQACLVIPIFSHAEGTLEFTLDRATGQVEGFLEGNGGTGFTENGSPRAFHDCLIGDTLREHFWQYEATVHASLSGKWNPDTNEIVMTGSAVGQARYTFVLCRLNFNPYDCAQDGSVEGSASSTVPIVLRGTHGRTFAYGGVDFTDVLHRFILQTDGTWETHYEPVPEETPAPTPTPTPTPTPPPGPPAPPPLTVCTECPDDEWAAQTAESWAQGMLAAPSVCQRGGACGPPNPSAVAAAKEQYRTCLLRELRAGAGRTDARVRCFNMLPIAIPFG